jgi:hypothetical protein
MLILAVCFACGAECYSMALPPEFQVQSNHSMRNSESRVEQGSCSRWMSWRKKDKGATKLLL